MGGFFERALEALRETASSPAALLAYLGTLVSFVVYNDRRGKLKAIALLPLKDRRRALHNIGAMITPSDITGEEWIQTRKHFYNVVIILAVILAFLFFGVLTYLHLVNGTTAVMAGPPRLQVKLQGKGSPEDPPSIYPLEKVLTNQETSQSLSVESILGIADVNYLAKEDGSRQDPNKAKVAKLCLALAGSGKALNVELRDPRIGQNSLSDHASIKHHGRANIGQCTPGSIGLLMSVEARSIKDSEYVMCCLEYATPIAVSADDKFSATVLLQPLK
jgi:hypothetical protein